MERLLFRHGIGHFLSVHEGPQGIATGYRQQEEPLMEGVFLSNEPGYYRDNDFGIRIEDDMETVVVNASSQFLRFDTITVLPYERSMIDIALLSKEQIEMIDRYHQRVFQILEPLLSNDPAALKALQSRTILLNSNATITSVRPPVLTTTSHSSNITTSTTVSTASAPSGARKLVSLQMNIFIGSLSFALLTLLEIIAI
jgi:hypothetical protein